MPSICWSKRIRAATGCCIPALFKYAAIGQLTRIRYLLPPGVPFFNATKILLPNCHVFFKLLLWMPWILRRETRWLIFRKLLQIDSKCCTHNLGIGIYVIDWGAENSKKRNSANRAFIHYHSYPIFISTHCHQISMP